MFEHCSQTILFRRFVAAAVIFASVGVVVSSLANHADFFSSGRWAGVIGVFLAARYGVQRVLTGEGTRYIGNITKTMGKPAQLFVDACAGFAWVVSMFGLHK